MESKTKNTRFCDIPIGSCFTTGDRIYIKVTNYLAKTSDDFESTFYLDTGVKEYYNHFDATIKTDKCIPEYLRGKIFRIKESEYNQGVYLIDYYGEKEIPCSHNAFVIN